MDGQTNDARRTIGRHSREGAEAGCTDMSCGQGERRRNTTCYGTQPEKGEERLHHPLIVEDSADTYEEEEGIEGDGADRYTADHLHE